ncbi:MAG: ABC transporter substrate-binding protein [Deltaproteobacteria bacterium]|nr:ABC transporter substrate-binding protein [Deltaproteobacteria bacterium]
MNYCCLLGALFVILVGCERKEQASVKIGVSLPLSGPLSASGQAELEGLKLALERDNQAKELSRLIIEDNKGDSKEAVVIAQKLTNIDKVNYYFTSFTHLVFPVKDLVTSKNVPLMFMSAHGTLNHGNPLVFRFYVTHFDLANAVLDYLKMSGYKKIFYIGEQAEICKLVLDHVKENSGKHFEIVHTEEYVHTEPSLKTPLLRVRSLLPEAIFACSFRSQRVLLKALEELRLNDIPLIQTSAYISNDVLTPELRNLYVKFKSISAWHSVSPKDINRKYPELFASLKARIGNNPQLMEGIISYANGQILLTFVKKCKADVECFKRVALEDSFDTIFGQIKFDSEGGANLPAKMVTPEEFYREFVDF